MSYTTWSTEASLNVTIDGINIDENCPTGGLNNAIRSVMAGVADMRENLPSISGLMPLTGGTFTGTQPRYDSAGAYWFHNDPAMTSGRVSILPDGSPNPTSPSTGDVVFFYTP